MFSQIQDEENNKLSYQKKIEELEQQIRQAEDKFQETLEETKAQTQQDIYLRQQDYEQIVRETQELTQDYQHLMLEHQ